MTKSTEFAERFETVVLRFTDSTYDELKKAGSPAKDTSSSASAAKALADIMGTLAHNRYTRYNLSARILQDILGTSSAGMFAAFIQGKNYDGKEAFILDPQGVTAYGLQPEEVAFVTYNDNNFGYWAVNHLQSEYAAGVANGKQMNGPLDIQSQKLDVEIEKNAELKATAITTFAALRDGLRVAPFSIFRNFKIESVTDAAGQPLPYIFEQRDWSDVDRDDADNFNIILPKALAAGESFSFKVLYGGKEAVRNAGSGNYFPVARHDWYPSTRDGDYADYEITFRIPKNMKIAATGTLVSEKTEGNWNVTQWKTEAPIDVAGFNFGKFKGASETLKNGLVVQSYANEEQPDWVKGMQSEMLSDSPFRLAGQGASTHMTDYAYGGLDTTTMMKRPLAEAQFAMQIYTDYFGPVSYKRLSITQQTACNFGQAWPGLVWLPICSFYDTNVRHQLGVDDTREPYWSVVTPHEVAHQWWGHTVGSASYRDEWMAEGFAELSASIFAQAAYSKNRDLYTSLWKMRQQYLQEKNEYGFSPIQAGPVTIGKRVAFYRSNVNNYQLLVYGKGSFILHMIRMMLSSPQTGEQAFKEVMKDFVATYHNKPASTEDFKAILEKHITPDLDLDGNGKLDWFFNEWVYGTELPKYEFTSSIDQDSTGDILHFRVTQSGVSPAFKMLVPVYIELQDGRVFKLGSAAVVGNNTVEKTVPVGKLNVKRLLLNYNYDVLSAM